MALSKIQSESIDLADNFAGMRFGGTASDNALNDYEEGTWTATYEASDTGNNPTVTYSHQTGKYVKVGGLVHIDLYIRTTAVTGTTGGATADRLRIAGLPFTASGQGSTTGYMGNFDGMSNGPEINVANGQTRIVIRELDGDGNLNDMFTNDMGTGNDDNQLHFSLTYPTDS